MTNSTSHLTNHLPAGSARLPTEPLNLGFPICKGVTPSMGRQGDSVK